MSTKVKLIHVTPLSVPQFEGVVDLNSGMQHSSAQASVIGLRQYVNGYLNGARKGSLVCNVGEVSATATLTLTGEPTAAQTVTVANHVITAGSTTTGSTFAIGTSVTQTAAAIASAVNLGVPTIVSATSTAGTVVLTAVSSGASGNGMQLSSTLGSTTAVGFTGGTNGTVFNLSLHG